MHTPSLFEEPSAPKLTRSTLEEVPQARFLSWSPARQFSYMAMRDEDSAQHEEDPFFKEFYQRRAASYEEMSICLALTTTKDA